MTEETEQYINRHVNALYLELPEEIADINTKIIKQLEARLAHKDELLGEAMRALKDLSFMAQTSGGTVGKDKELCKCIERSKKTLQKTKTTNRGEL